MTISFSSSNLRDGATSGDYRLDKRVETTPSTSVFDRADYRQFTELHGQKARDTAGGARGRAGSQDRRSEPVRTHHALEQLADYGLAGHRVVR